MSVVSLPRVCDGSRLTPLYCVGRDRTQRPLWRCQCACGNETTVHIYNLRSGNTLSCGCFKKTCHTKHGESVKSGPTPEYLAWNAMIQRCTNQRHKQWAAYGGRGIAVCQRWMNYEAFLADMGRRPTAEHSIDRFPDKNGNYEPSNCRWATRTQQQNNIRSNHLVDYRGRTYTVAELARLAGIKYITMSKRLHAGWSTENAVNVPVGASRA